MYKFDTDKGNYLARHSESAFLESDLATDSILSFQIMQVAKAFWHEDSLSWKLVSTMLMEIKRRFSKTIKRDQVRLGGVKVNESFFVLVNNRLGVIFRYVANLSLSNQSDLQRRQE